MDLYGCHLICGNLPQFPDKVLDQAFADVAYSSNRDVPFFLGRMIPYESSKLRARNSNGTVQWCGA